jgi:hypothetical protein
MCLLVFNCVRSHGRSGAAMSAAAFCLLVLNVLGTPKPKFAQLASSVFGLFYCGKQVCTALLARMPTKAATLQRANV